MCSVVVEWIEVGAEGSAGPVFMGDEFVAGTWMEVVLLVEKGTFVIREAFGVRYFMVVRTCSVFIAAEMFDVVSDTFVSKERIVACSVVVDPSVILDSSVNELIIGVVSGAISNANAVVKPGFEVRV